MNKWVVWIRCAVVRAIKTFAQVFASMMTIDAVTGIAEIEWMKITSVAAVSAIFSLVTSVAGLPEVDMEVGAGQ